MQTHRGKPLRRYLSRQRAPPATLHWLRVVCQNSIDEICRPHSGVGIVGPLPVVPQLGIGEHPDGLVEPKAPRFIGLSIRDRQKLPSAEAIDGVESRDVPQTRHGLGATHRGSSHRPARVRSVRRGGRRKQLQRRVDRVLAPHASSLGDNYHRVKRAADARTSDAACLETGSPHPDSASSSSQRATPSSTSSITRSA